MIYIRWYCRKDEAAYDIRYKTVELKDIVLNAMSATKIPIRLHFNEILVTVRIIEPEARMGRRAERGVNV